MIDCSPSFVKDAMYRFFFCFLSLDLVPPNYGVAFLHCGLLPRHVGPGPFQSYFFSFLNLDVVNPFSFLAVQGSRLKKSPSQLPVSSPPQGSTTPLHPRSSSSSVFPAFLLPAFLLFARSELWVIALPVIPESRAREHHLRVPGPARGSFLVFLLFFFSFLSWSACQEIRRFSSPQNTAATLFLYAPSLSIEGLPGSFGSVSHAALSGRFCGGCASFNTLFCSEFPPPPFVFSPFRSF